MPPNRLPRHFTDALLRALHEPGERVARYSIVWGEGDVHMEVAYLTDEQQQHRLVAQLTELRERVEDGEFIDGVKWTIFFPERPDGSYGQPLILGNPDPEQVRCAMEKVQAQREGLGWVERARQSSRRDG